MVEPLASTISSSPGPGSSSASEGLIQVMRPCWTRMLTPISSVAERASVSAASRYSVRAAGWSGDGSGEALAGAVDGGGRLGVVRARALDEELLGAGSADEQAAAASAGSATDTPRNRRRLNRRCPISVTHAA